MARKRSFLIVLVLLVTLIGGSIPAGAATPPTTQEQLAQLMKVWNGVGNATSAIGMLGYQKTKLAEAQPDECYKSAGDSIFPWDFQKQGACPAGYAPKTNDAYVWGLAKSGNRVWWGTGPNILCGVLSGYLGMKDPIQTSDYACEFGQSKYGNVDPRDPSLGSDFRPTHIYYYDLSTNKQVEVTPDAVDGTIKVLGIRSGGSLGDTVILGGPDNYGGISLYFFKSSTGEFQGSKHFSTYTNIRKWIVINNQIYTGAKSSDGQGAILRWTGVIPTASTTEDQIFEVVGRIPSEPAEFAYHENRLFTATWPGTPANLTDPAELKDHMAGVFMSEDITKTTNGRLSAGNASGWKPVWKAADYDPDLLVAMTYGGGALASFGGYLYWGTMHVPGVAAEQFIAANYTLKGTTPTQVEALAAFNGTHRAISIFRGKNFGASTQKEEIVYGESSLPTYSNGAWTTASTSAKLGKPLYGRSGFGNTFNNYTWTMQVMGGQLYVGTMDWSYLIKDYLPAYMLLASGQQFTQPIPGYQGTYGADLVRFRSTTQPALLVSSNGLGNNLNYGLRTMLADGKDLFIGTADPMNLNPNGGWELYRLKDPPAYLK